MRTIFLFFALSLLLLGGFVVTKISPILGMNHERVTIEDGEFDVEVVRTPIDQERGLSGRSVLPAQHGMLFVFGKPGAYGFWMKNMHFPIDIVWISKGKVSGFEEDAKPDDSDTRPIYYSSEPIDTVLEIPAGSVREFNIKEGSIVKQDLVR